MKIKALVNPFFKQVDLTLIENDCENSVCLFFDDTDEWKSFKVGKVVYDIHFFYEENSELLICVYYPNSDGTIEEIKCDIEIKF